MEKIYLDNNATTKMDHRVLEAMLPYFEKTYGNASSVHVFGRDAHVALDEAREKAAVLLRAKDTREIIFTSGGTESDNFAIKGIAWALKDKGNHIITSKIEHQAVLNPCQFLEKQGFKVTYLNVDKYGIVDLEELKKSITDKTILVSIMYANNEIGTIEPIKEIVKIAKEKGVLFHTDAVQVAGKIPLDVENMGIDLLSLSAHKFYGPKGVGVLYLRNGVKITPLHHGGHHERNLRAGTENMPSIVGLGKACEIALDEMEDSAKKVGALRDRLQKGIEKNVEFVRLNSHPSQRLYNTLNMSFEYLEGESIILNLDLEGIGVSTGSACTSGSLEPSHVLTALGLAPEVAHGSVRFSLSKYNTEEEIDKVIEVLPPIIKRLRSMSPLYADRMKKQK